MVLSKKYTNIVFDLDGTLLDSSLGICNSVRYAEANLGLEPISNDKIKEFLGPPPKEMYIKHYGLDEQAATHAVELHREYGMSKAIYEVVKYPYIEDMLRLLVREKFVLSVATLKREEIAKKIIEIYDLNNYFTNISGMNKDESYTKGQVIQNAIRGICDSYQNVLVVGDTENDHRGAMEAGVDFLGVTYGYGYKSGTQYNFDIVNSPMEICEYVLKDRI